MSELKQVWMNWRLHRLLKQNQGYLMELCGFHALFRGFSDASIKRLPEYQRVLRQFKANQKKIEAIDLWNRRSNE